MPRRVYLLGVGLALVALAFAFTDWALSLQPGVTEANVKRVRAGMMLAEVEALFGRKADDRIGLGRRNLAGPWETADWEGEDGQVLVLLDRGGRVIEIDWHRQRMVGNPLARLRAWLGW
jgi:hypothetical protein